MHYAYTHAAPDGTVFYVGMGKGPRAHLLCGRSKSHQDRIDWFGRKNVIVQKIPARDEAHARQMEREMLQQMRADGLQLCNQIGFLTPAEIRKGRKHCVVYLPEAQAAKLKQLGSGWLAKAIDMAKS